MYIRRSKTTGESAMHKITFQSSVLKGVAGQLDKVIKPSIASPLLSATLVKVRGNKARFCGADGAMLSIGIDTECISEAEIDFAMPIEDLKNLTKNLPGSVPVEMVLSGRNRSDMSQIELARGEIFNLDIRFGKTKASYACLDPNTFPSEPLTGEHLIPVDADVMASLPSALDFSSIDTLRPSTTGVMFFLRKGGLQFVSTNMSSLYESRLHPSDSQVEVSMALPSQLVRALAVFPNMSGIGIRVREMEDEPGRARSVAFEREGVTLYGTLFTDRLLDYKAVMPRNYERLISMDADEFTNAVRTVTTIANNQDKNKETGMSSGTTVLEISGKTLSISSTNLKQGKTADSEITLIDNVDGDLKLTLNSEFLLLCASKLTGTIIMRHAGQPNKATLFTDETDSEVILLMPYQA